MEAVENLCPKAQGNVRVVSFIKKRVKANFYASSFFLALRLMYK